MLALPVVLAIAAASPDFPDPACLLLAKGDGFAFHAVRSGYRAPIARPEAKSKTQFAWQANPYGSDSEVHDLPWVVTHTDLRTGRLTKLFQGGSWHYRDGSPDIGRGMTTKNFLAYAPAFAADDRHLYLMFVHSTTGSSPYGSNEKLTCTLRAYRGETGRLVASHPVTGFKEHRDVLKSLFGRVDPPQTFARLTIGKDGLKIGDTQFRHKDGVLTPSEPPPSKR